MSLFEGDESVDYAEGGTPVETHTANEMQSAVSDVMVDSLTSTNYGSMAELAAEAPNTDGDVHQSESAGLETVNLDSFVQAHSADFRDVSSMGIADYEQWLFKTEEEAGELAIARVISNFRASGYEVKPPYAAIAAATWSRANYAGEDHTTALSNVERAPVAEVRPYVVEIESEGVESLIDIVRKAESNATDYKAEMIAELRAEMEAESKGFVQEYGKTLAITAATVLGIGLV